MTPSATPMLMDNTGQVDESETVRFGVDGRAYEIDLPARRASELRSMAGRYISAARTIPPALSRARQQQARPRAQMDREQSRRIRSWALQRGLLTSPRGRIPQHVVDEYEASLQAAPAARAARDEPAATALPAAAEEDVHGGEHGLTDGEKQELRAIADAARPQRNIVAGRLRTKGLADRDTAGNWWLTDAGRRELMSA
jgi:hypothetical protein